ncbi:hypothetical protein CVS40_8585 [Lucilia cuprina]|nr:hypothetical protein CVS40_8585 [Lucilia cuprina]
MSVLSYFSETDISGKVQCNICKKQLNSLRKYNLKMHLKSSHNIEPLENKITSRIQKKLIKTKIEINRFEIIRSFIGLVTENGIAFDILNSDNIRNLLKPICAAIADKEDNSFKLNSENAKLLLPNVVRKLKETIRNELNNNLFSIKIDSATRLDINIFGISIQYCRDGSIVSRIVGMSELKGVGSSKAKNLAAEIIKMLNKYDLKLEQVVSITSDNGANMLKTSSLLSQCVGSSKEVEENDEYLLLLDEFERDTDFNVNDIAVCRCDALHILRSLLQSIQLKTQI